MIDLHSHSTASDGTFTPKNLLETAIYQKLHALALTDHDTTDGLAEFLQAGREHADEIEAVPGIELSCLNENGTNFHITGLFINPESESLQALLGKIQQWRIERNEKILVRLQELGVDITREEVQAECPGNIVGRPHFASVMMRKGYCRNLQHAFAKYIGRGRPAYVSRFNPKPDEAIAAIHGAGGVAIWAHPYTRGKMTNVKCQKTAEILQSCGLDGMEAFYTMHTPAQTRSVLKITSELGLLVSGGSDFHGTRIPDIILGKGHGNLEIPDALLEPMKERLKLYRK